MPKLAEQLAPIADKDPIVSTFDSRVFSAQHTEIIHSYNYHASTYIEFDPLRDLERRFIQKVLQKQTPKACLIGQYGHGKTTTAIGIWQACREVGILAIPPASYVTLSDLALGAYAWLKMTFEAQDQAAESLDKLSWLYQTYLQSSTEQLARLVSRRSGRSYEQVIEVLTDPSLQGSLRLDPSTANIVLFLEALTQLATAYGYTGLVIVIDEFQQLLGQAGPEILTGLRGLIWGLRTRQIPLGLLITMDPNSERILGERAGDILHRIKDDDLYLNFQQVYHPDFPRLLWERYATQLNFNGLTYRIVDKPTLESLGQICERPDLSNGPRTVVNAFARIADHYKARQQTYTPLHLIDDFVSGAITFDGDAKLIAGLVSEFANYPYFRRSSEHQEVLKLLAAFPNGCPPEIANHYGLLNTFEAITSELRGEIITRLPNGFALIDLQLAGKPLDKLGIILKKYWLQISDAEINGEETTRRFTEYILPLLFPVQGQPETWTATAAPQLSANDSYHQAFKGRLHARHSLRTLALAVGWQTVEPAPPSTNSDLCLNFVLHTNPGQASQAWYGPDRSLNFSLNLALPPVTGLPPDLRLVEHNLSPQPATPAVLLNVIEFIERETGQFDLSQPEQLKISRTLENIRRYLLNTIFEDKLLAPLDQEAATPGYRGMRDFLYRECERRFPAYHTLMTSATWQENLTLYRQVLSNQPLAVRRGLEPLADTKTHLVALFGQRTHSGFDSKLRVQYPDLLEISWSGEQGSIQFKSHPLESELLTVLTETGLPLQRLYQQGRQLGYTPDEIENALALLIARGQARQEAEYLQRVDSLSLVEIRRIAASLAAELTEFSQLLTDSASLVPNLQQAQAIAGLETAELEAQELAHSHLTTLTEQVQTLRRQAHQRLIGQLESQRQQLTQMLRALDKPIPSFNSAVKFKSHLEGTRKLLEGKKKSLQKQGEKLRAENQKARSEITEAAEAEIAAFLARLSPDLTSRASNLTEFQRGVNEHLQKVAQLQAWIEWGEAFARLYEQLRSHKTESATINDQLVTKLESLESQVSEWLATEGTIKLGTYLEKYQTSLRGLQLEYDRNLADREAAFETEKQQVSASLARLIAPSSPRRLRAKYQISKHNESYQDLYDESLEQVKLAVSGWQELATQLEAGLVNLDKNTRLAGFELREIKALLKKFAQTQAQAIAVTLDQPQARLAWRDGSLAVLTEQHAQLAKIRAELIHPSSTLPILQDRQPPPGSPAPAQLLGKLLDVQQCLAELPADSPLAALLRRYLNGEIVIEVKDRPS